MPILDVDIVLRPQEDVPPGLAERLADRAAEVFGALPQTTWVKVRTIPAGRYAENGAPTAGEPICPVFVSVLKGRAPSADQLRDEVPRLTRAVASVCGRPPEHVHIVYLPEGAGRIAFGGTLLER